MDERVEMRTALSAVRRRPLLAALVVLLTVAVGLLVTALTPKVYASTSTVFVGDTSQSPNIAREGIQASQDLAATYTDLARRQPVLEAVVDELDLDLTWPQLRDRLDVTVAPGNEQLVVVTARGETAQQANEIAGSVTEQLLQLAPDADAGLSAAFVTGQLQQLQVELAATQAELADVVAARAAATSPEESSTLQSQSNRLVREIDDLRKRYADLDAVARRGTSTNSLQVLEPASLDPTPVRPNPRFNLLSSVLIGGLLALGICYWADSRNPRPRRRRSRAANASAVPAHAWTPERERDRLSAGAVPAAVDGSANGSSNGSANIATHRQRDN